MSTGHAKFRRFLFAACFAALPTAAMADDAPLQCDATYEQVACLNIGGFMHQLGEYRDGSVAKGNAVRLLAERIDKAGRVGSHLTGHSTKLVSTLADVVWELDELSPETLAVYGVHYCDLNFEFETVGEAVDVALSSLAGESLQCQRTHTDKADRIPLRDCVCDAATGLRAGLEQQVGS